jgi:glucose-6-phosphate isomerase
MSAYETIKKNILSNKYPFLEYQNLLSEHIKEKDKLNFDFENYIIVGIGGSSQGSKAVSHILNQKNIYYFDYLNVRKVDQVLNSINHIDTGFIFISKSGSTSEVLTLYDYISEFVGNEFDKTKNFLAITENNDEPLYRFATHSGFHCIEHNPNIGGRFSIFSHTGLIPISLISNNVEQLFLGLEKSLDNFINNDYEIIGISPLSMANKKYELISNGKKISVMLFYGDELVELGNWLKQLFAESLGKQNFGYLPIVSKMTQDQHSLLQLYLDGPRDKFFEIYSADYNDSNDFINITLSNHKEAMIKTLESENLPIIRVNSYEVENSKKILPQLGYIFSNSILEVLLLSELGGVDPFGQDAVEKQKNFLK